MNTTTIANKTITSLLLTAILVGVLLILGIIMSTPSGQAFLHQVMPEPKTASLLTLIIDIAGVVVLGFSAWMILKQLRQQDERHYADRVIAWKNSALGLNQFAMRYPEVFKKVLYPMSKDADEVMQVTAAYSSLHALEVMYYMRKDEEDQPDRIDVFLREYVASHELRKAWTVEAAQTAFTKEFQERLNNVINRNPLPPAASQSQGGEG